MSPKRQSGSLTKKKKLELGVEQNGKAMPYFEGMIDYVPEALIAVDNEYKIIGWNVAAERIYGWKAEDALGKVLDDILQTEYHNTFRDETAQETIVKGTWSGEVTQMRKDGKRIPVRSSVSVVKDAQGAPIGFIGINCDISEQKRIEEQVNVQATRLKILADASQAFTAVGQNYQAVLDQVVHQAGEALADMCNVRLFSDDGQLLELAAIYSRNSELTQALSKIVHSILKHTDDPGLETYVFHTGKPAFVPVITTEQLLASLPPEYEGIDLRFAPHSYIVVSLRVEGHSIGVLSLTRYRTEQPAFTEDDVTLAQDLADRAALAINNTRLFGQVQKELAERMRAEKQVVQMKRLYATLSQVNQTIVRVKNHDELYRSICEVAAKFGEFSLAWVGLLNEESGDVKPVAAVGQDIDHWPFATVNIHSGQNNNGLVARAIRSSKVVTSEDIGNDERIKSQTELIHKYGYHSTAIVPFRLKGKTIGVIGLISGIKGFFKSEDEIRLLDEMGLDISFALDSMETEKLMRQWADAFEYCAHGIVIGNSSTNQIVTCNSAFARAQGSNIQELSSQPLLSMYETQDQEQIKQYIAQSDRTGNVQFEARKVRKDGSVYDVLMDLVSVRDENRNLLYRVATQQDITERKHAEREIKHRTDDLVLINALNDAVNRGEDIEGIAEVFAHETRNMFACQDVAIYLLSPDAKYIEMQSSTLSRKLTDRIEKLIGRPIPRIQIPLREGSYFKQILANEQGTITGDPKVVQQWIGEFTETTFLPPVFRAAVRKIVPQIYKSLGLHSTIAIPLISSGQAIGVLDMSSKGQFTEEDLRRIRNISYQITAVILRKQAEKQVQLQLQRMSALREIDRVISSSLDMRLSLDVVLNQVLSQLGVNAASILLLNQPSQTLEYVAGKGFRTLNIRQTRMRLGDGLAGQVGLERKVLHVSNLTEVESKYQRKELFKDEEFLEYFGVPLIAKGTLKGVLEIFHRSPLNADMEWVEYLETLGGQAAIAIDNVQLFENIQQSNLELVTAYDATIEGWSRAMDLRDKETEGHTQRVTELSVQLARKLGISQQEVVQIRRGALLHDIGKLGIPDNILLKPDKLTQIEWAIMRQHPKYAFTMLLPITYLRPALDIPYCHHEKWDGTGYPRGIKGEQIPLAARLFAVVDVWDALRSDRPYRAGWSAEKTREYIIGESGKHFDPNVVEKFMKLLDESPNLK